MGYCFSGSVELTADDKNRFRFPAKYRACYANYAKASAEEQDEVYILRPFNSKCLTVFPKDIAENLINTLKSNILNKEQEMLFLGNDRETKVAKYYLSHIEASKVDNQGRFVISQKQMGKLNIGKEIIMLGIGDRIEIWDKKEYELSCSDLEAELEAEFSK